MNPGEPSVNYITWLKRQRPADESFCQYHLQINKKFFQNSEKLTLAEELVDDAKGNSFAGGKPPERFPSDSSRNDGEIRRRDEPLLAIRDKTLDAIYHLDRKPSLRDRIRNRRAKWREEEGPKSGEVQRRSFYRSEAEIINWTGFGPTL